MIVIRMIKILHISEWNIEYIKFIINQAIKIKLSFSDFQSKKAICLLEGKTLNHGYYLCL